MARPTRHGKGWRIRWIDANGKRQSKTYRRKEDAILEGCRRQLEADAIRRGLQPARTDRTFSQLAESWRLHRARQKRSANSDASIVRRHLMPAFGDDLLTDITTGRISAFAAQLDRAPKTVHNVLTQLGAMLNHGVELSWLDRVPKIRKPCITKADADFSYLQTQEEITRLLEAARVEGEHVYTLYATAILTGMRAGELAGLRRSCVDFEHNLILVNRSYTGPTKNSKARHVPISRAYSGSSLVIFKDNIARLCEPLRANYQAAGQDKLAGLICPLIEGATWVHELGHLMGLVNTGADMVTAHQDEEHGAHCDNPDCIMYWLNNSVEIAGIIKQRLDSGNEEFLPFDQNCLDDLDALAGGD